MTATVYRESCGTVRGAVAHQAAGEPLCGWCLEGEALARLRAESVPSRPPVPRADVAPVSARQADANATALDVALDGTEWEPGARQLRVIKGSGDPEARTA